MKVEEKMNMRLSMYYGLHMHYIHHQMLITHFDFSQDVTTLLAISTTLDWMKVLHIAFMHNINNTCNIKF